MRIVIGLTGPTGAGKTSVRDIAQEKGIKVIDCDLYARKAVEKGSDGLKALESAFGKEIINSDGELNRSLLASLAFSSKEKTELLNKTIFPFIKKLVINEINTDKIIIDAPTLFESGLDEICDKTVAVLADEEIRLKRIMDRDKIDEEAAQLRMSAGQSDEFFKKNADFVIYNNVSEEEFKNEISCLLKELFGGK